MHQYLKPSWKTGLLLVLAIACLAAVNGCLFSPSDKDGDGPPPPPPPGRSTPAELLTSYFKQAYTSRDSILYADMLDEEYSFYFLLEDADSLRDVLGQDNFWGRTLELQSAGNLFKSEEVTGITLNISITRTGASNLEECLECTEVETFVTLRVETVGDGTEPLTFTVDSPQIFYTRRDPADSTLWVLWRQIDRPSA